MCVYSLKESILKVTMSTGIVSDWDQCCYFVVTVCILRGKTSYFQHFLLIFGTECYQLEFLHSL
jgi:hypothetical protein